MANEAFALSPISARAAEPTEADYDAIREAFMETARGRWFLGEYAKRNRNADTRMVLDAVAKIEETLAAQRQPVVVDRLPEALVAIRKAIAEAETTVGAAFDRAALEASLSPIGRGIRIIKEISWRWREIGADGRICDLIDSQLATIESACAKMSGIDPGTELKAAFELLRDRVEQTGGEATAPHAAAPAPVQQEFGAAATPVAEMPQQADESVEAVVEAAAVAEAAEAMDIAGAVDIAGAMDITEVAAADMVAELSTEAAAEAEDDAILEMVALEMAAPDADFDELPAEPVAAEVAEPAAIESKVGQLQVEEPQVEELQREEPHVEEPHIEEPIVAAAIAEVREAIATTEFSAPSMQRPAATVMEATPHAAPAPLPEPSLGSTILASGMLQKPRPANDPLAPIRRMTQAEKIAFFS